MDILGNIKKVLESNAGHIIGDWSQPTIKSVVDNRLSLIKKNVNLVKNKDNKFYIELIKLIGTYIDQLVDREVKVFPSEVFDKNGETILQDYDKLSPGDWFDLEQANIELSKNLFKYVCSILKNNKDIKLDVETLKRLFNRNPKLSALAVNSDYIFRPFNFKNLARILNKNETLEKSNIRIDEVYQLLLDTCQINNDDVFGSLVKAEQFQQNHQKIDEILMKCDAVTFVEMTYIIRRNFDKNFDRFRIVKKRNKDNFCEKVIMELLYWHSDKDDYNLIHKILTDSQIKIDYNFYSAVYTGGTDLKSIIALSGNRTIIKDFLSQKQNIQNYYKWGVYGIQLYILYAIIGDYEKALANFEEKYNFKDDLNDSEQTWDKSGFSYEGLMYEDSLARFISGMCYSFKEDNIDYSAIIDFINRIINSDNVKYINLKETLTPIQDVLSDDDFKLLIDALLEKHNSGNLGFLVFNPDEYIISIANEEEVQNYLDRLNKKEKKKILIRTKRDDKRHNA